MVGGWYGGQQVAIAMVGEKLLGVGGILERLARVGWHGRVWEIS